MRMPDCGEQGQIVDRIRIEMAILGRDLPILACHEGLKAIDFSLPVADRALDHANDAIVAQAPGAVMVHLHGTRDVLGARLEGRSDHFMPATLLDSQLATLELLEDDERGFVVDVDQPVTEILGEVRARLVVLCHDVGDTCSEA